LVKLAFPPLSIDSGGKPPKNKSRGKVLGRVAYC
jgi:hypothetical protein